MEPIISPWIIYLFSILTKLNTVAFAVMMFSWAAILFIGLYKLINGDDMEIEFNFKNAIIVAVIATTIVILIPTEKNYVGYANTKFYHSG